MGAVIQTTNECSAPVRQDWQYGDAERENYNRHGPRARDSRCAWQQRNNCISAQGWGHGRGQNAERERTLMSWSAKRGSAKTRIYSRSCYVCNPFYRGVKNPGRIQSVSRSLSRWGSAVQNTPEGPGSALLSGMTGVNTPQAARSIMTNLGPFF